jgi:hypothetical protein
LLPENTPQDEIEKVAGTLKFSSPTYMALSSERSLAGFIGKGGGENGVVE